MGKLWAACLLLISSHGLQAAALSLVREPPSDESLWHSPPGLDGIDLEKSTYVVRARNPNRLFAFEKRKPVMWVHVHKSACSFICASAHRANESVVEPSDGTCNSRDMHDTFLPDGLHSVAKPPACKDRAAYFRKHNFTWGQVEHEIGSGQMCTSDFLYGVTLRETVSRMASYVNWNTPKVLGARYREMMACIEQRNESMCPYNPLWDKVPGAVAAINFGYREYDNFLVRSLGGYDVMGVPLGGINRTHYDLALKALGKIDVVLVLEEMFTKYSQDLMDSTLGWHVEKKNPPVRANAHTMSFTGGDVQRLQRINQYDVQLYAQALKATRRNAASHLPQGGAGGAQAHLPRVPEKQEAKPKNDAKKDAKSPQAQLPRAPEKQEAKPKNDAKKDAKSPQAQLPQAPEKQKAKPKKDAKKDAKSPQAQLPRAPEKQEAHLPRAPEKQEAKPPAQDAKTGARFHVAQIPWVPRKKEAKPN